MDAYGIDDLFAVANIVPGMVFSRAPDDGLALTFWGLGTPARTQSFDQSVAIFRDGMFVGKGRMYSSAFFDVERMEFIKGTQSTLLGKNSSLVAISIITRKLGDTVAVRLAGHYVDKDGWVENLLTGSDVPADEDLGLRATFLATPTDRLTITAALQYSSSERKGNGFQFVDNGNFFPPPVQDIYGESVLDDTKSAICPECPNGDQGITSESPSQLRSIWLQASYYF